MYENYRLVQLAFGCAWAIGLMGLAHCDLCFLTLEPNNKPTFFF